MTLQVHAVFTRRGGCSRYCLWLNGGKKKNEKIPFLTNVFVIVSQLDTDTSSES